MIKGERGVSEGKGKRIRIQNVRREEQAARRGEEYVGGKGENRKMGRK